MKHAGYQLIVADPAWRYGDKLRNGATKRGARDVYRADMGHAEMLALPVSEVVAERAVLALWVTSSHIFVGAEVMKAWGFRYTQMGTWGKVQKHDRTKPKIGMGRFFRQSTEHWLIGVRGGAHGALELKNQSNLILEPGRKHSAKPEALQDRLELMLPTFTRRLELFARRERFGWTCLGNEIDGRDLRDSIPALLI